MHFGSVGDLDMFHHHLDRCAQCRNEPHNLCPIGQAELCKSVGVAEPKVQDKTQTETNSKTETDSANEGE